MFKLLDINGDGLPDKVIPSSGNRSAIPGSVPSFDIEFNHGAGFEILNPPAAPSEFWYRNRDHWPIPLNSAGGLFGYFWPTETTKSAKELTADINGDGLPDHLVVEGSGTVRTLRVLINNGGAMVAAPSKGDYVVENATALRRNIDAARLDPSGEFYTFQTVRSLDEDWGGFAAQTVSEDWGDMTAATDFDDRLALS